MPKKNSQAAVPPQKTKLIHARGPKAKLKPVQLPPYAADDVPCISRSVKPQHQHERTTQEAFGPLQEANHPIKKLAG
jgi:hypothetical protein